MLVNENVNLWTNQDLLVARDPEGKEFLKPLANRPAKAVRAMNIYSVGPREFLGFEMSMIKEVEAVYVSRQDRMLYVSVIVNDFDREVRQKIYEREMAMIDEFESYDFDFNILSRRGRKLEEVIHDPALDVAFIRQTPNNCGDQERAPN